MFTEMAEYFTTVFSYCYVNRNTNYNYRQYLVCCISHAYVKYQIKLHLTPNKFITNVSVYHKHIICDAKCCMHEKTYNNAMCFLISDMFCVVGYREQ